MGGTDLYSPLRSLSLLSRAAEGKQPMNVFIFSDGNINDEEQVALAVAQSAQKMRVFTFGFGSNCRYVR